MKYQVCCAKCGTIGYKDRLTEARQYAVKHSHGFMLAVHDTRANKGDVDLWELQDNRLVATRKVGLVYGDYIYISERSLEDVCLQHRRPI